MLGPNEQAQLQIFIKLRDHFSKEFKAFGTKVKTDANKLTTALGAVSGGFARIGTAIKGVVAAWVGWKGAQYIIRSIQDFAKLDAATRAFQLMAEQTGIAEDAVGRWREAVRKTVSDMDLMRLANEAITAGFVRTEQDFTTLAQAAFLLGRVLGRDVLDVLQELTSQIAGGRFMGLRRLGVNMEEIVRQHKELTGETLSNEEQKRIAINILAERLRGNLGKIASIETTISEKLQRSSVEMGNARESIGQAHQEMVEVYAKFTKTWETFTAEYGPSYVQFLEKGVDLLREANQLGRTIGEGLTDALGDLLSQWERMQRMTAAEKAAAAGLPPQQQPRGLFGVPAPAILPADWAEPQVDKLQEMGDLATVYWDKIVGYWEKARQEGERLSATTMDLGTDLVKAGSLGDDAFKKIADSVENTQLVLEEIDIYGIERLMNRFRYLQGETSGFYAGTADASMQFAQQVGDSMQQWAGFMTDNFRAAENAIGSVFFDAIQGRMKSFKEYLLDFLTDISRAISQFMAKTLVMKGIEGIFSALLPGAAKGLMPGAALPSPWEMGGTGAYMQAGGYGTPTALMQEGGILTQPTLTLAGERPEAFVPLSRGRAIPVEMRGARGGEEITINHNWHVYTIDSSTFESWLFRTRHTIEAISTRALERDHHYREEFKQAARR